MPAAVSGGSGASLRERVARAQAPPRAAAPTSPAAAATSAPVFRARPSRKAAPAAPAPVRQLQSERRPSGPSASPMALKSSISSASVSRDQSPEAKLTRPGAPWAMTCKVRRPGRRASAAAIWRAAGRSRLEKDRLDAGLQGTQNGRKIGDATVDEKNFAGLVAAVLARALEPRLLHRADSARPVSARSPRSSSVGRARSLPLNPLGRASLLFVGFPKRPYSARDTAQFTGRSRRYY